MLKKEAIEQIAGLLKVKAEDLTAALTNAEAVDFAIPEGLHTFEDAELTKLKTNSYNEGRTAGVEIAVKTSRDKLGLEFQGKTIDGLLEAYQKKVLADAKIEPEKKVTELNDQIKTLKATVTDYETKLAQKDGEVKQIRTRSEVSKYIPDFGENGPALAKDDVINLMAANGYEYELNDTGKLVFKKGGELVKNKLGEPVDPSEVVTGFMKEKKLVTDTTPAGGRGEGDKRIPGGKPSTFSEAKKIFESQGKHIAGEEFATYIETLAKENKEFAMDK